MWQKLSKNYPPQFELVALFLVLLTFYLTASNYSSLLDKIPTHFNFRGVPDDWDSRKELLVYPILSACLSILFTVINVLLAIVKDPRKLINLPPKRKAALSNAQIEKLRIFLNRSLFALKILIQGLLAYSLYITIEVALFRATSLGVPWFLFMVAILMLAGYMVWESFRITSNPNPL